MSGPGRRRSGRAKTTSAAAAIAAQRIARPTQVEPPIRLGTAGRSGISMGGRGSGNSIEAATALRQSLENRGTKPVIPNKSNRKQPFRFDRKSYRERHRIENAFCRLKDFRRIATRYDRLARNFLASVCLVAAIVWWI